VLSRITVIALTTLFAAPRLDASPEERFQSGLEKFEAAAAYWKDHPSERAENARRYRAAAAEFVAAWKEGLVSTEVLTNAANSFAFASANGEAVLFYRRALASDPGNSRARDGLDHLREKLPISARDRSGDESTGSLADSLFFWHREQNFHLRRILVSALFPLGWLLFAAEIFLRKRSAWNGPFALLGYVSIAVSAAFLISLTHESLTKSPTDAAVVLIDVQGRTGPGQQYQPSHTQRGNDEGPLSFPPGTEVGLTGDSENGWVRILLLDETESWVPETTVESVVPVEG
jgi:hypothetical protein